MHSGNPAVSAVLLALLCLTLFSLAGCASSQSPQGPVPASSALPQQEAGDASSVFVEVKSSDNSFNSDLASHAPERPRHKSRRQPQRGRHYNRHHGE